MGGVHPIVVRLQDVDVFQSGQVSAAFVHDHFFGQAIAINGLLEEGGGRRFVTSFGQHKVNGIAKLAGLHILATKIGRLSSKFGIFATEPIYFTEQADQTLRYPY